MIDDTIQTYKDVLSGSLKRFPRDFWEDDKHDGYKAAASITRYLIEDILKWDDDTLKTQISCHVFFRYKLKGMLYALFDDSVYRAIENAYPGKFHEWELACTPRNFWTKDTAIAATIWLFRERLGLSDTQIEQHMTRKVFTDNGFSTMLRIIYKNNVTDAVNAAFPELHIKDNK